MSSYKVKVSIGVEPSGYFHVEASTYYNDEQNNLVFRREDGTVIVCIHADHWFWVE